LQRRLRELFFGGMERGLLFYIILKLGWRGGGGASQFGKESDLEVMALVWGFCVDYTSSSRLQGISVSRLRDFRFLIKKISHAPLLR
jgi:hypothetical protein